MAKGDGSIIEKARGVWEVQVPLGRDPATGKYRKVSRTVRGTKADARKARDRIRRELEDGLNVEGEKLTFGEFAASWLEGKAAEVKPGTLEDYAQKAAVLSGYLGSVPLRKLDARTVETALRRIQADRSCGNTTLRRYFIVANAILKKAVSYDLVARNPCDKLKAPAPDKVERRSLSIAEASGLLRTLDACEAAALASLAAKEGRQAAWGVAEGRGYMRGVRDVSALLAVRIGLATGMRLGEVLRLTWELVDVEGCALSVRDAKTPAGNRTVFVDRGTMAHIAAWKATQAAILGSIGLAQSGATPVICAGNGAPVGQTNFEGWWRAWRDSHGFEGLKFHELRHTQATRLLAAGVDVKTVQARLGHESASVTLNYYAHAQSENDRLAAAILGDMLRSEGGRIVPMRKSA